MAKSTLLLVLVSFLSFASSARVYTFPEVSIQVIKPRSLRVSISRTPGDHLFAFHANVNKCIETAEPGDIFDQTFKKNGREWVINVEYYYDFKKGDKLYYWIYVNNGPLGYRRDGEFKIQDLDEGVTESSGLNLQNQQEATTICERVVVNLTSTLHNLDEEVATLKEDNKILTELLEKDLKLAKGLILEGLVAQEGEQQMVVEAIVKQKLELDDINVNVVRGEDNKVEFEVGSLEEKLAVIKAAETGLTNSRFSIVY